jgi:hypothetical protein
MDTTKNLWNNNKFFKYGTIAAGTVLAAHTVCTAVKGRNERRELERQMAAQGQGVDAQAR